jgi:hypothetical protein
LNPSHIFYCRVKTAVTNIKTYAYVNRPHDLCTQLWSITYNILFHQSVSTTLGIFRLYYIPFSKSAVLILCTDQHLS